MVRDGYGTYDKHLKIKSKVVVLSILGINTYNLSVKII